MKRKNGAKKAWKTRRSQRYMLKSVLSGIVKDKMMSMRKMADVLDVFQYVQEK